MTPDHVRGRLSSDAGVTSSSINSLIAPSPMPTLSPAPSLTLSPVSTTSGNLIHRPFAGGLLRSGQTCIQVHGVDAAGETVLRQWLQRGQAAGFFAHLTPCLVGI